jgi:hypothetical protein
MTNGPAVECAIAHHKTPAELHRGPMTRDEAREWIREFEADGGRTGTFVLIERYVSAWEPSP